MSTTSIAARATIVGSAGNIGALTIDTENGLGSLSSPPMGVAFAKNPSAFVGGTDEETDEQRMDRFRLYIEGLARCTVNGLISGAKSVTGVRSASVRENYPAPGWVSVYCDDGSGALPATTTLLVYKVLNGDTNDPTNYWGYRAAGIQVQVLAPTVVPVSLTIILYAPTLAVSIDAELQAVATTAVTQYIDSLYMGNDVVIAEVIASVQNASDDIYDCSIVSTNPAAGSGRITITAQQVAKTQTVAITVTRGSFPS